jgi:ATP-binding cassette, subfamily B, bacterial
MPRSSATQHELARIELLAGLPGDVLMKLAKRMARLEIAPGTTVVREGEPGERFYVVFAGMLSVTNSAMGPRDILRPGDYFGEVAVAMNMPRTATVTAITPAVVAGCDRATFDEFLRPLFADDD